MVKEKHVHYICNERSVDLTGFIFIWWEQGILGWFYIKSQDISSVSVGIILDFDRKKQLWKFMINWPDN